MRPIPRRLLIHSVGHHKIASKDSWGNETLDVGETIVFVRMEPCSKVIRDKNNQEIQLAATLFYDCKNSCPRDVEWALDDIVIFNGQKHKVQLIEPLYDEKQLHHYEIGLIRHA